MIQDPRTMADRRSGALDRLLDDLVLRMGEVGHAVVLSNDGLTVGASTGLRHVDTEHLAAVVSGFHGLAEDTGRHFGAGGVRRTMVEMADGYLFVAAADDGTSLAVLTPGTADIGRVACEMARLVNRVGEHLGSPPRGIHGRPPGTTRGRPGQMTDDETHTSHPQQLLGDRCDERGA
ncbi:dynein regulation protein LC7 [Streptomyces poonensis]|uniref:Dynein regulation protein LC7 n=1 Tax=Streptomyces poonensis TaxID=68255 RepID=A0A918Q6V5_9ACTN|nr:dynein regulation protein LC7 [Streptomyces poonensis]GLJ89528.1 dynein regulation protein LC7 [Streptomyces poonensis]